jgi:hypothetical protein
MNVSLRQTLHKNGYIPGEHVTIAGGVARRTKIATNRNAEKQRQPPLMSTLGIPIPVFLGKYHR